MYLLIVKLPIELFYILFIYNKIESQRKIFIVSDNKTGTTSLKHFFVSNGYRVAPQWLYEMITYWVYFSGKDRLFFLMFHYLNLYYQIFQDDPFTRPEIVREVLKKNPNSKYIHVTRSAAEWYESLYNHHAQEMFIEGSPPANVEFNEKLKYWRYRGKKMSSIIKCAHNLENPSDFYEKDLAIARYLRRREEMLGLIANSKKLVTDLDHVENELYKFLNEINMNFSKKLVKKNVRR